MSVMVDECIAFLKVVKNRRFKATVIYIYIPMVYNSRNRIHHASIVCLFMQA